MGNTKFFMIVAVLIILGLGILWLLIEPIIFWTDQSEFKLYCRIALMIGAVATFGILRLYNAVMGYTKVKTAQAGIERNLATSNANSEKQSKLLVTALKNLTYALDRNSRR